MKISMQKHFRKPYAQRYHENMCRSNYTMVYVRAENFSINRIGIEIRIGRIYRDAYFRVSDGRLLSRIRMKIN